MRNAIKEVFTEAWHGLCTYNIMQNAVKHLCNKKKDDDPAKKMKKDEDEEPHILSDFSACKPLKKHLVP
jgi:zinc finger SWIM domain-containing protein 3